MSGYGFRRTARYLVATPQTGNVAGSTTSGTNSSGRCSSSRQMTSATAKVTAAGITATKTGLTTGVWQRRDSHAHHDAARDAGVGHLVAIVHPTSCHHNASPPTSVFASRAASTPAARTLRRSEWTSLSPLADRQSATRPGLFRRAHPCGTGGPHAPVAAAIVRLVAGDRSACGLVARGSRAGRRRTWYASPSGGRATGADLVAGEAGACGALDVAADHAHRGIQSQHTTGEPGRARAQAPVRDRPA